MTSLMLSKWTIFALSAGLSVTGCATRDHSGRDTALLTDNPWKYEKAGFDSNDDGIFDALDTLISGCEKDNTIIFRKDGTGYSEQKTMKCRVSDPDSLPFIWAFQNNDSTIWFQDQYFKVRTLNPDRFEIYA